MNERKPKPDIDPSESEEKLKKSEDRYYKMIDEVEDYAIILLDEKGIIQNWNKGAQKIKGYTEHEVVGKHFSIFYLPEDQAINLPQLLLNKAAEEGRAIHEGWRQRKDGSRFWGSITLTALHSDNGQVIGYSKVTRDLTERKLADDQMKNFTLELQQSNEALRKSEERYHKMIAEVQDYAIILLDPQGNIQNWNTGAEKIKGYSESEILGKNFRIFYTEEDKQQGLPEKLLRKAADHDRAIHEGWRITKSGSRFWGSIVITALHNERGDLIGFSKVTRDLTEKKKSEDKLNKYLQELQKQNEELDRFAYAASHDLQEPLRKIQTFADMLENSLDDKDAARKYLGKINTASERMSHLISSILEFSRLSKEAPVKELTDLNETLRHVLTEQELRIHEKQARIESGKLPSTKAISLQMHQLFTNLISNSLKYSQGQPVIKINASVTDSSEIPRANLPPGTAFHHLSFTDNGIGFEPQYAEKIFTMFQRLHGKHEYSGTGIGLALCKKIMDNHGGYIHAESTPGEGATFHVYIKQDA
ncbi:MAG: sensor histidine kinase [Pseudobacter sp.]|uniref:sensor histidine kinase n=1 Tax=Pseudobacter sp. TaxID=2045420 RepID=UPI003F7E4B95